jgi:phosphatidylserine synthase
MRRPAVARNLRRGVYVIPTSLTILNVFFGFSAMILAMRGMQANTVGDFSDAGRLFRTACWYLVAAAVFDTFDGLVARLMKATSEFGKEYDSLADVVTFGAAPAVLVYAWAIINYAPQPVNDRTFAGVMLLVTAGLAFAEVSTIRYRSQKFSNLQRERSFVLLFIVAIFLVVLYRWPSEFLLIGFLSYVSSGPLVRLWTIAFPSRRATAAVAEPDLDAPTDVRDPVIES